MNKKAKCLKCQYCYVFNAKEGERYVCTLYGNRLLEDKEDCKGYVEAIKK